jgi:NADH:ubiquinone oxidoreductase subunit 4 (subunit M)
VSLVITVLVATEFVLSAIYSLWLVQRVFHGEKQKTCRCLTPDTETEDGGVIIVIFDRSPPAALHVRAGIEQHHAWRLFDSNIARGGAMNVSDLLHFCCSSSPPP